MEYDKSAHCEETRTSKTHEIGQNFPLLETHLLMQMFKLSKQDATIAYVLGGLMT